MDSNVAAAIETLDDLTRRLSVPGATCTASELAAVADRLRQANGEAPAVPAENPQVAEAVAALAAEVQTLEAQVSAPAGQPA